MRSRILMTIFVLVSLSEGVAAQSAPPRKDIPAIAKSAKGAIVTIVMANNDKPIARGTGFVVEPSGVIVTNYHVIETGNVAIVKFADGTILPGDGVLAADKIRDLAIIKIHGKNFPTLTLGNSDKIQVGEEVVAIGNPLGLELTVSNGILSGVRRDESEGGTFLQTTAPISHGSSGGPLFNMLGEVVGINAMYLEGGENLNFAIPVNDAKSLLQNQFASLHNLPNEPPTKTPVAKKRVPNTPVARTKEPRFSDEFVRAAIITINGLITPSADEFFHEKRNAMDLGKNKRLGRDLQNVVDLEKDGSLRASEQIAYFQIMVSVSVNSDDTRQVFLDRVKQIVESRSPRSVSIDDAVDLAADEPEYKAVLQHQFACTEALKTQLHEGKFTDEQDICSDLKPITAYRESVIAAMASR